MKAKPGLFSLFSTPPQVFVHSLSSVNDKGAGEGWFLWFKP